MIKKARPRARTPDNKDGRFHSDYQQIPS
jgi:hypothetical protein